MGLSPNNKECIHMCILHTVEKHGFDGAALTPVNFTTLGFHKLAVCKVKII